MFAYVDSMTGGILNLNDDPLNHVYKRYAIESDARYKMKKKIQDEEKQLVMDIKTAPMKIKTEVNKDVKILSEKTYFRIPTWSELGTLWESVWEGNPTQNPGKRSISIAMMLESECNGV